uniref:Putative secreted protein n=1 Tax=Anopheles darlingi TaxID=43151 RepID=A0A2M4DN64_ANODA
MLRVASIFPLWFSAQLAVQHLLPQVHFSHRIYCPLYFFHFFWFLPRGNEPPNGTHHFCLSETGNPTSQAFGP